MPIGFSAATRAWTPYLASLDDGVHGGLGFLQAWIERESGGNPCSYPYKTGEVSIWQFMPSTVRGNSGNDLDHAGSTADELHPIPPCAAQAETRVSVNDLTQDQIDAQIRSGRTYLDYAIGLVSNSLASSGSPIDQSSSDFWQFVKLVQGAPSWVIHGPSQYAQETGTPLASWDDFETWAKSKSCWGSNHCSDTLANARAVGSYGGSDPSPSLFDQIYVLSGPSPTKWWLVGIAGALGLAAGVFLYQRRAHRRIGTAM